MTFWKSKIIVFCQDQLDQQRWDVRQVRANIQPGEWIGDYDDTHAFTWVHEWAHLLDDCKYDLKALQLPYSLLTDSI